jgi:hypothetical protein
MNAADDERAAEVLQAEYGVLMSALTAAWSASLARTTIFLAVLSAAGVALGFAARGDANGESNLPQLALVVLPLLLFLGLATFVRVVQIQREAVVYVIGLNRIRYFMQLRAPASKPFFVMPPFDDQRAIFRSFGTGISRRPPRFRVLYLVVQTQGIVGVVNAAVAAAFVGLALARTDPIIAWGAAAVAFAITVIGLFVYWQRSLQALFSSIRPINPTPPDAYDQPI